jgi:hypothetical protein
LYGVELLEHVETLDIAENLLCGLEKKLLPEDRTLGYPED